MRISVNLATRPFVELRPFFARLRIIMVLLVLVAIGLGVVLHMQHIKLVAAEAQMRDLQAKTEAAKQEKKDNESRMRQPANAAVLDRARFLNRLFLAKSFSWTAVMMDLETVLPAGVQVTSIEPQATPEGDVVIRLRVAGDRDRAVQLVRNLERSRRFLQPHLSAETAQAKDNNGQGNGGFNRNMAAEPGAPLGVQFEILANYNPVPPDEAYLTTKAPRDHTAQTAPRVKRPANPANSAPAQVPVPGRYPRGGVVLKPYAPPVPPARPQKPAGGVQ
ncbi:MAG TPA: PilN domain-containing protein [Acidobacteriaceae bacterium]|jgi:type IV pilus assembly protein PilN